MAAITPARVGDATPATPGGPAPLLALGSGERPTPAEVLPDRTRALGTLLFMAADAMVLGTIVAAYFALRSGSSSWPPRGVDVGTYIPTIVSITALLALFSAQWAVTSTRLNDQRNAAYAIGLTVLFGIAMVTAEVQALRTAGFGVGDHAYGAMYYLLFAYSIAHVVVGIPLLVMLAGRALAGHFSSRQYDPMRAGVLYWHYSMAVWLAVATVLFVASKVHG
jgi:heme/copper-type cytochrome/quinol oxidase subunit 3